MEAAEAPLSLEVSIPAKRPLLMGFLDSVKVVEDKSDNNIDVVVNKSLRIRGRRLRASIRLIRLSYSRNMRTQFLYRVSQQVWDMLNVTF